jgi:hypothetical protein
MLVDFALTSAYLELRIRMLRGVALSALLVCLVVVGGISAFSIAATNNTCPPGLAQCCAYPDANGNCPPGDFSCYNPKSQSCCSTGQDDCPPVVCNSTTQTCALPCYGCEYAGQPVCCPSLGGAGLSCMARHSVSCYDNRTQQCCGECLGYPTVCSSDSICCAGYWGGTCCPHDGVCCQTEPGAEMAAWCCEKGQKCGSTVNKCS